MTILVDLMARTIKHIRAQADQGFKVFIVVDSADDAAQTLNQIGGCELFRTKEKEQ